MIVVELLDGLGGKVVEVLVRAFGVEPLHPFGGAPLDVVDVVPGALLADEFVLERADRGLGQVSAEAYDVFGRAAQTQALKVALNA